MTKLTAITATARYTAAQVYALTQPIPMPKPNPKQDKATK